MKLTLLPVFFLFCIKTFAANNTLCGNGRYDTEIFSSVTVTSDIVYGSNNVAGGGPTNLTMDIYEPQGDTLAMRPLIVWAHGGSFIGGTKTDADVVSLCQHFAKRGYVCVSINYRVGFAAFPPDAGEAKRAVFRGVQDMKAAVRYFRKDAVTTNTYKIDPNIIFAGGSSAGAFCALHLAYMDDPSELPAEIDTTVMGGMEGNSGNPGYSSEVNAVINLCGALGDKHFMHSTDEPLVSMHGNNDGTVPYATDIIVLFGLVPVMLVDGSYSISDYADSIGLTNEMYTFYGADHVPYLSNTSYMDTTVRFVSNFLYRYLGCIPNDPTPLANTFTTGVEVMSKDLFSVYPNPSHGFIQFKTDKEIEKFFVYDLTGKIVFEKKNIENSISLELDNGVYFYRAKSSEGIFEGKIVILN